MMMLSLSFLSPLLRLVNSAGSIITYWDPGLTPDTNCGDHCVPFQTNSLPASTGVSTPALTPLPCSFTTFGDGYVPDRSPPAVMPDKMLLLGTSCGSPAASVEKTLFASATPVLVS